MHTPEPTPRLAQALSIEIPGLRLAAMQWGEAKAPPILALHGWLDNAASFAPLAARLLHHRVVALDLAGHGLSEHRPIAAGYNFIDWIPDVFEAADALGWDRFGLMGHSLGAGIGSLCAGTFPQRIASLVLLEGLGPLTSPPGEAPDRVARAIRARRKFVGRSPPVHANAHAAAARVVEATGMSEESALLLTERGTRPIQGGVTWRCDPRLRAASSMRLSDAQVEAFLEQITCPVLLLRASEGYPVNPDTVARRVAKVANIEVIDIDGTHHVHMDHADIMAAKIDRFLRR